MKWASSLALVLLVVCVTYAKPPLVERVCTPNDSWKEDCNDCICSEDNKPMCTRRDCTPSTTARPHECRRGETWAQGCNTCRCGSTGIAMCTMKACLEVPTLAPFPESCRPGATWMNDCNTCRCVGGRSICTMMACLGSGASSPSGSTPLPLPIPVGDDCTPGDTWKEKCNSCRCTPNGLAVCTLMKCLT